MLLREFHYRWEWQLQSSPEALWPLLADTNRFNRDTGVSAVERRSNAGSKPANSRRRLRLRRLGIAVDWEEEPFEWTRPQRFGVVRRYFSGPLAMMRVLVEISPRSGDPMSEVGSRVVYQVRATPRNLLGLVAIPIQIGWLSARNFAATIRRYDQLAASKKGIIGLPAIVNFAPGGKERLTNFRKELLKRGAAANLVTRLIQTVELADDFILAQIRPYALAEEWRVPRRDVLELCLLATRVGLLEFCWTLLCPLCRGAKTGNKTLRDLRAQVHCESCNIDFTANFERSVEFTFRPNPAVREIEMNEFCVGGPQITPHIVAQQLLAAGTQRVLTLPLEIGRYRVRTSELPGGQYVNVTPDGSPQAVLRAQTSGWSDEEIKISPLVVFTDLRGSTKLYREIGDAVAFSRVLNHFDILKEAIAAEGGAVVKTIGDAVMAVFRRPLAALRALLHAQQKLAAGQTPLHLKAGVHYGPCIAVTLNDRLDYFGSTINIAARLEGQSSGSDVIISAPVRDDPEVVEWLRQQTNLMVEPVETTLKGFDERRFELWRVTKR